MTAISGSSTTNTIAGVTGTNSASGGCAILGTASGTYTPAIMGNATALGGMGLYGESTYSSPSANNIGVFGACSSPGYACTFVGYSYLQGGVTCTGYFTKSGGGYRVDHPSDPANKMLNHNFVESPEMMNIYRGRITLDASGNGTIALPSYVEVASETFEYQLTAIGASMPGIFVSEEIANGQFKVSGGVAGKSVSWQVSGARADSWAKANDPGVEIEKTDDEKGFFIHPELFGSDDSKHINSNVRNHFAKKNAK